MTDWETVDNIPRKHQGREKIILAPGQIMRRLTTHGLAGSYTKAFRRRGLHDYHAIQRTVDGDVYVYIWRDPLPEA